MFQKMEELHKLQGCISDDLVYLQKRSIDKAVPLQKLPAKQKNTFDKSLPYSHSFGQSSIVVIDRFVCIQH